MMPSTRFEAPTQIAAAFGRPLENKVAIITGASRGIGAAAARIFAQAGAAVVLAARDEQAILGAARVERRAASAHHHAPRKPRHRPALRMKKASGHTMCAPVRPASTARTATSGATITRRPTGPRPVATFGFNPRGPPMSVPGTS